MQLGRGFLLLAGEGSLIFMLARLIARHLLRLPVLAGVFLEALLLKQTFSLKGLHRAANDVQRALTDHNLAMARKWLGWHLVSRDVSNLNENEVAAAAIESLAENTSDGVIAPWFWYMVGGLPAAYFYRFVNTSDAMLGYHDEMHEWLGKAPARGDDLLNLIPARLTAILIIMTATLEGNGGDRAWRIWRRDAHLTQSPNAGHPMSAMSGALGVRLGKEGLYELGAELPPPRPSHISQALHLLTGATFLAAGLAAFFVTFYHFKRSNQ